MRIPAPILLLLVLLLPLRATQAEPNLEAGKEINGTCAACHGDRGQGGKKGEYPRLAGQNDRYLMSQLKAFRARTRVNIPMYPYTQERELSNQDIEDISGYLAGIELSTRLPQFAADTDALTRLLAMEQVMIVPRVEGDVAAGGEVYQKLCGSCHGKGGKGRGVYPMIVGQYTNYLMRQVEAYRRGERPHDQDEAGGVLDRLGQAEIQNILAYLTSIQGGE